MARTYKIVPFKTGCVGGSLNHTKLEATLNEYGGQGWKFERSIHETTKQFLVIQREAHFLIFSKEG